MRSFDGDLEDYRSLILGGSKRAAKAAEPAPASSKAEQRRAAADRRQELAPLKKKIKEIKALTEKLEKSIQEIDALLADPSLYEKSPDLAAAKAKERSVAESALAEAEDQWLILSDEYATAMAD